MSKLRMPTPLRGYVGNRKEIEINAPNVGAALQDLARHYPELRPHLFDGANKLRPFVSLFLNGRDIRELRGAETPLGEGDTLMIVPSIAGG